MSHHYTDDEREGENAYYSHHDRRNLASHQSTSREAGSSSAAFGSGNNNNSAFGANGGYDGAPPADEGAVARSRERVQGPGWRMKAPTEAKGRQVCFISIIVGKRAFSRQREGSAHSPFVHCSPLFFAKKST